MRHLKRFSIFESTGGLTPDQTSFLDRCVDGTWTLNSKGEIDVEGDFLGSYEKLKNFMGLKFGRVTGDFRCDSNDLTSLAGSPSSVEGHFWCDTNRLTSLVGAPSTVRGDFLCFNNSLTSLDGGPEEVGGKYDCTPNVKLVSLKGAPEILKGVFKGPGGIRIPPRDWSPEGIFETWKKTEDPREKALLATLLTRERLQKEIDEDPAAAMGMLRPYLAEDWLKDMKLIWPESTRDYVQTLTDLGEIGF